ncbi:hypothetical protein BLNAU_14817 [Blattamonas nauphoetae]|uniref:Uncharacterized protein n=1 Tax=Blattamonas nauphoetae TaxID=2049346 RepID=A0ABQ9XCK6_9EUKA|nr:hypothetical protein BLNAU_14817 [Blattamonas nauphoetae]
MGNECTYPAYNFPISAPPELTPDNLFNDCSTIVEGRARQLYSTLPVTVVRWEGLVASSGSKKVKICMNPRFLRDNPTDFTFESTKQIISSYGEDYFKRGEVVSFNCEINRRDGKHFMVLCSKIEEREIDDKLTWPVYLSNFHVSTLVAPYSRFRSFWKDKIITLQGAFTEYTNEHYKVKTFTESHFVMLIDGHSGYADIKVEREVFDRWQVEFRWDQPNFGTSQTFILKNKNKDKPLSRKADRAFEDSAIVMATIRLFSREDGYYTGTLLDVSPMQVQPLPHQQQQSVTSPMYHNVPTESQTQIPSFIPPPTQSLPEHPSTSKEATLLSDPSHNVYDPNPKPYVPISQPSPYEAPADPEFSRAYENQTIA